MKIQSILIAGGGVAGFTAALSLKLRLPHLDVRLIRRATRGLPGLGLGTTTSFSRHFFVQLHLRPQPFYSEVQPTWKLGTRYYWGARDSFHHVYANEYSQRSEDLSRNHGYFVNGAMPCAGFSSALASCGKVFLRKNDGTLAFDGNHGFNLDTKKLLTWLENATYSTGVDFIESEITVEKGEGGVAALVDATGTRHTADLYIDATGLDALLIGGALSEPILEYSDSLFCDRAMCGSWERTTEIPGACSTIRAMDAGWSWQVEHESRIDCGMAYSSKFIADDAAMEEFRKQFPSVSKPSETVRFQNGRRERNWAGNVVAVGYSSGFVEPLEADELHLIEAQCTALAESLVDSVCDPSPSLVDFCNLHNAATWDSMRDMQSLLYKFNSRLDTPFWEHCRRETHLHGADPIVNFYKENGPTVISEHRFVHPSNSFRLEGFLALLIGQGVPHSKVYTPSPAELKAWNAHSSVWRAAAARGYDVKEALAYFRNPALKWS